VKHRNDLPEVSVGSSTADLRMNIHKVCIQRQILASGLCPDGWSLAEMIDSQWFVNTTEQHCVISY